MNISEIQPNSTVTIKGRVLSISPQRTVKSKRGNFLRVCEAIIGDSSGRIPLTLWQKQVYLVKIGDVIELVDVWAAEYQNITRVSLGRSGRLTTVEDPEFPSIHDLLKDIREEE